MSHPEARDFSEVRQVSSAGLCGVGSNLLSSSASRLLVYTAVAVVLATATTSLLVVGIQRTESTVKTAATARNCHEYGGVGLLVFADPEDVAPQGPSKVYPNTGFVDGSALQRGSLYHYGDPETPAYPSVDRFIITGAHHDSWGVGAAEPTSATAALLELGHALGTMLKKGWTPRRTIVLASWAAGEMAFAGASEWVEARPSGWFPSYHTAYDDGEVFARKLDPQYALTLRCCQMNGAMTLRLAEDAVLPYRVAELAKELQAAVRGLDHSLRRELAKHDISLDWLKKETVKFQQQAKSFESWLKANKKIE
ncbi:hypothetical protein V5799_032304 [Amblyomma americanum]|uniref:Peptidase M28 domain-containing protein n=1 Tax=Amblyomma americanum TaxID=6943 RepID=A0AAQ4DRJ9_AMBAM